MKSVSKLIAFSILLLFIFTVLTEVTLFYVTKAKFVAMSTSALENSVPMASFELEDAKERLRIDGETSYTHSKTLLDVLKNSYERYFENLGENISLTKHSNVYYNSHFYDYSLAYQNSTTDNKIKAFDIYIDMQNTPNGIIIDTALSIEVYFNSKILRETGLPAGDFVYYDTLTYNLLTEK